MSYCCDRSEKEEETGATKRSKEQNRTAACVYLGHRRASRLTRARIGPEKGLVFLDDVWVGGGVSPLKLLLQIHEKRED